MKQVDRVLMYHSPVSLIDEFQNVVRFLCDLKDEINRDLRIGRKATPIASEEWMERINGLLGGMRAYKKPPEDDLLRWMDEIIEDKAFSEWFSIDTERFMPPFVAIRDRLNKGKKADLSRAAARIEDDPRWKVAIGREMSIITGPGFEARITGPQHEEAACVMAQADDLLNGMEDIEKKSGIF